MDVSTRWNSTFDMLERFLEQQPAIEATLFMKELKKNSRDVYTLSEDVISSAEKIVKVLKPIKTVTTILCGESSPTVSLIHPLKEMLLQQLGNVNDDSTLLTSVKAAICKDLGTRYSDEGIRLFLLESSCLEPRFKAMPYLNDEERRNVFDSLADKVEKINLQKSIKTQIKEEKVDDDKLPCDPALPCTWSHLQLARGPSMLILCYIVNAVEIIVRIFFNSFAYWKRVLLIQQFSVSQRLLLSANHLKKSQKVPLMTCLVKCL